MFILVAVLRCFEAISAPKVNFFKSVLVGISVEDRFFVGLANIMGCKVVSVLTLYLVLPLCLGSAPKSVWNPVVKRVEQRFGILESRVPVFRW